MHLLVIRQFNDLVWSTITFLINTPALGNTQFQPYLVNSSSFAEHLRIFKIYQHILYFGFN